MDSESCHIFCFLFRSLNTHIISLQTTEVFLFVFDAALLFLVTFILAAFHPSKVMTVDEDGNVTSTEGLHEMRSFVPSGTSSAQDLSANWAPKNTHGREYGGH